MDNIKNSIEPAELLSALYADSSPLIIDVCRPQVFDDVPRMIAGSVWRDHKAVNDWGYQLVGDKKVIVNCVHGHNVSQMAVALLRAQGVNARYLQGGVAAWETAGGSTISRTKLAQYQNSQWVTRENPKIDRIACPWLIRRFIDPHASFYYVSAEWVQDIAEETGATAFDIDATDTTFTHVGDLCTVDAFINYFDIRDPALNQLASIVRGADTAGLDLAPQAAGLSAISSGLSAVYRDDLEMLEKGMIVYDALYSWCRNARDENHNWTGVAT